MKKTKRFATAYVVTFSVGIGCKPAKNDEPASLNPPAPIMDAKLVTDAGAAGTTESGDAASGGSTEQHSAPKAQRQVRSVSAKQVQRVGGINWNDATKLNPKIDNMTVFTGHDGSCYIRVPTGDSKGPGAAVETTQLVDCPSEMNDPAWDTCLAGQLLALPGGECACAYSGNPPPPATVAECPKHRPK
jgi:hypothetical protein